MNYLSCCSGIEAATVAWHLLGWKPLAFSEIEKFSSAVLKYHYPNVPNLGDMTKYKEWDFHGKTVDLLVGGTPCQSFSVAGLRKGLEDLRGNLMLTFLGIADRFKPRWIVWENVPGVLSSVSHNAPNPCPPSAPMDLECDGQEVVTEDDYESEELHALNCFVARLRELGYGWARRVLDAEYFGVPQRRRRVFVVGYLGDWQRAAKVLFEPESLRGDSPPRRKAGQEVTPTIRSGTANGGPGHGARSGDSKDGLIVPVHTTGAGFWQEGCGTLRGREQDAHENLVVGIDEECNATVEGFGPLLKCGQGGTRQAVAYGGNRTSGPIDVATTLQANGSPSGRMDFASETFIAQGRGGYAPTSQAGSLRAGGAKQSDTDLVVFNANVRPDEMKLSEINDGLTKSQNAAIAFTQNQSGDVLTGENAPSMGTNSNASGRNTPKVFHQNQRAEVTEKDVAGALNKGGGKPGQGYAAVRDGFVVRRITPTEAESLQGFPRNYTNIPWKGKPESPDGPRYKALGNSFAVPVVRWLGERIDKVDKLR